MLNDTDAAFAITYAARRVLVLGDTPAARIIAADAVERVGAGVSASLPITTPPVGQTGLNGAALILVEIDSSATEAQSLETLFDRLIGAAGSGTPSVITVPRPLLDFAAARVSHANIDILCEPTAIDRVAAIGLALVRPAARLNDVSADPGSARLRQLSEEVGRIARTLATLSSEGKPGAGFKANALFEGMLSEVAEADSAVEASTIRTIIRARRLRGQFFAADLFADPAWDILLDLTAARLERTPVAVSSLCIAAAVPPTTALRWIKTLTDAGLLIRAADTRDGRRVFIELSETAASGMLAYLAAAGRLGALLV